MEWTNVSVKIIIYTSFQLWKFHCGYHCAKERYVLDLKNTGYTNGIGDSMSFSVTICQSIKYSKLSGLRLAEIN